MPTCHGTGAHLLISPDFGFVAETALFVATEFAIGAARPVFVFHIVRLLTEHFVLLSRVAPYRVAIVKTVLNSLSRRFLFVRILRELHALRLLRLRQCADVRDCHGGQVLIRETSSVREPVTVKPTANRADQAVEPLADRMRHLVRIVRHRFHKVG